MAVMVYLSDMDGILGPGQNLYVYLSGTTRKFVFIPWQDHSFGQFPMRGSQDQRENLSIQKPWDGENHFLERVFKVDAFKKAYLARLNEYSSTLFKPERFPKQVDDLGRAIRPAVKEESDSKLEKFDKVVLGESIQTGGFGGGPPGGFGQSTKPIKPFVKIRSQSIADQLAGKSPGQVIGAFGGPGGPRGPGGPDGFGPGMFLSRPFMEALDADKDGVVSSEEFKAGFAKWFDSWNTDKSGTLTEKQLRTGINKDFDPFHGSPPPDFGPPPGE